MGVRENLRIVQDRVAAACAAADRPIDSVTLMAVSKVHPVERLLEAIDAGHRLFGENRVQEFQGKAAALREASSGPERARFHLIGPLQNNKTAKAAELFDEIDTIDSIKTAERVERAAVELNKSMPVLVEVKLSHEESKHGVAPDELPGLLERLSGLERVVVQGLMTVPPWSEDAEVARPYFRRLRELRDQMQLQYPLMTELSMGMSNDFTVAIAEGSTCVRIGTAIFGRRTSQQTSQATG